MNLRFSPNITSNFGITYYESLYDRVLNPQVIETIIGGDGDLDGLGIDQDYDDYSGDVYYLNYMSNSADPEINAIIHHLENHLYGQMQNHLEEL